MSEGVAGLPFSFDVGSWPAVTRWYIELDDGQLAPRNVIVPAAVCAVARFGSVPKATDMPSTAAMMKAMRFTPPSTSQPAPSSSGSPTASH